MKTQLVALALISITVACSSKKELAEAPVQSVITPAPVALIKPIDTTAYGFERVYLNNYLFIPDNMGMGRESPHHSIAPLTFEEIPPETFAKYYKPDTIIPEIVPYDAMQNYAMGGMAMVGVSIIYFEPLNMYLMQEVGPPTGQYYPDQTSLIDSTNRITYHLLLSGKASCNNVIVSPDKKHLVYYGNNQAYNYGFNLAVAEVYTVNSVSRLKDKAFQEYKDYKIMGYAWVDNNTLALSLYKKDERTQKGVNKFVKTTF